jgi:uncharacterized protein (TIGR02145 family)
VKTVPFLILLILIGCRKESTEPLFTDAGTLMDSRDSNEYKCVKIGTQVWMAENLAYLPSINRFIDDQETFGPPYPPCYYVWTNVLENQEPDNVVEAKATANYITYGVLYNWTAALSACPAGWHLPSNEEWTMLINYLGGNNKAGGKLKEAGKSHWKRFNEGADNRSGFMALPAGNLACGALYYSMGEIAYFWSSAEYNGPNPPLGKRSAWYIALSGMSATVSLEKISVRDGFSVRCIKDQ